MSAQIVFSVLHNLKMIECFEIFLSWTKHGCFFVESQNRDLDWDETRPSKAETRLNPKVSLKALRLDPEVKKSC